MLSRYSVHSPLLPFWGVPTSPLQSTMNRLFQDFETALVHPFASQTRAAPRQSPRVELRDHGDTLAMLADLPGLQLENIELEVEGETVTLKTKPPANSAPEGFEPLRRERQPAAIEWSFELPYPIDASAASARLEQGRLSVTLPKAQQARSRTIPVKAG